MVPPRPLNPFFKKLTPTNYTIPVVIFLNWAKTVKRWLQGAQEPRRLQTINFGIPILFKFGQSIKAGQC